MAEIKVGCFGSVNHRAATDGQERIEITLPGKVNGSLETGEKKGKQEILIIINQRTKLVSNESVG